MCQKLWTKTSVFIKSFQKSHKIGVKKKETVYILTKSKIDTLHFVENLLRKNLYRAVFFISSKFRACVFFFFLTLKVIASSTQFLVILENFDIQKIIEELKTYPNFKNRNEDHRLEFWHEILILTFPAYFSICLAQNMRISKFLSKLHIIFSIHRLIVLLQYYAKFLTKSSDFFFIF